MSNVEEVYNDNLPQMIQNTEKDSSEQINKNLNFIKSQNHYASLKSKKEKALPFEEDIKKYNTKD